MPTKERALDLSPTGVIDFLQSYEPPPTMPEAEFESAVQQHCIELGIIRDPNKCDYLEWLARLLVAGMFGGFIFAGVLMLTAKNNGIGDIAGVWCLIMTVAGALYCWDHR